MEPKFARYTFGETIIFRPTLQSLIIAEVAGHNLELFALLDTFSLSYFQSIARKQFCVNTYFI